MNQPTTEELSKKITSLKQAYDTFKAEVAAIEAQLEKLNQAVNLEIKSK